MAEMVTVACNLPHGLHLRKHVARQITPPQGGNEITEYIPTGERVTINGLNNTESVRFGFAMTEVNADFWNSWLEQHQAFPPIVLGHLFAMAKPAEASARAKDQEKSKTGMEPLDQDKPAPGIEKDDGPPTRGGRR